MFFLNARTHARINNSTIFPNPTKEKNDDEKLERTDNKMRE
jgi:hypothetical protein